MVNVLPPKQKRTLKTNYYVRLFVVACFGASAAVLIGALLLVPSYFASRAQADAFERFRDALEGSVGLKDREFLTSSMAMLEERVRLTEGYSANSFTVDFFESLLSEEVSGISIRNISFNREGTRAAISLSGVADSRASLLEFAEVLRTNPQFSDVDLPVSQLVAEEDVGFTVQAVYEQP